MAAEKRQSIFAWDQLKTYFLEELDKCHLELEKAKGDDILRLQGECHRLRRCLNLPETLLILSGKVG